MRDRALSKAQPALHGQVGARREIVLKTSDKTWLMANVQEQGIEVELDGMNGLDDKGREKSDRAYVPDRPQYARLGDTPPPAEAN